MFKLLNLIVTIFILYHLIDTSSGFNSGFEMAAETGNYSMLLYKGVYMLVYTMWLAAIYIVVWGGSEIYVTAQGITEEESN